MPGVRTPRPRGALSEGVRRAQSGPAARRPHVPTPAGSQGLGPQVRSAQRGRRRLDPPSRPASQRLSEIRVDTDGAGPTRPDEGHSMTRLLYRLGRGPPRTPGAPSAPGSPSPPSSSASPPASAAPPGRLERARRPGPGAASTCSASTSRAPATPRPRRRPRRGRPVPAAEPRRRSRARLPAMPHAVAVSRRRGCPTDGDTALLRGQLRRRRSPTPTSWANLEPARGRRRGRPATPASRSSSAARCPSTAAAPMEGHGELDRHRRRAADPVLAFGSVVGAGLPIGVAAVAGLGRRLRRAHAAGRRHGRQHLRPDGRHDGRPRRRHRLRAAAGHPARRVPPRRATTCVEAAGRAPRHRRPLGRLRRRAPCWCP